MGFIAQEMCVKDYGEDLEYWQVNHKINMMNKVKHTKYFRNVKHLNTCYYFANTIVELQIDEIWMEFCCEEKYQSKQEFVETETKKYEFEEETEIVEDFGKVFSKSTLLCFQKTFSKQGKLAEYQRVLWDTFEKPHKSWFAK